MHKNVFREYDWRELHVINDVLLPEHCEGELHIRRTHELAFRAASKAQLSSWWGKLLLNP